MRPSRTHLRSLSAILLCVLALSGCSSKKTVQTNQGLTTVETNALHNTMKISNKEGVAIIGKGALDPKALGLPLYPSVVASETGASMSRTAQGTTHQVSLTTKDSFEDVYQWYRSRLPAGSEQTHLVVAGGSIASFLIGSLRDKDQKSVMIQQAQSSTTIVLTHTTAPRRI